MLNGGHSSISIVFQRTSASEEASGQSGRKKFFATTTKKLHESLMNPKDSCSFHFWLGRNAQIGGDDRDRTGDPLLAKQVLSQLSYIPPAQPASPLRKMVGLTGVEPVTSPLSGARSNQLSYRPIPVRRRPYQHPKVTLPFVKRAFRIGLLKLNSANLAWVSTWSYVRARPQKGSPNMISIERR